MALSRQERKDQLGVWLSANSALQGTDEYNQKAEMFLKTREELTSLQRKDELGSWLANNEDKKGTKEYNDKGREFLNIRKSLLEDPTTEKETTAGAAYRRGIVQGATFEFYDEIKAGARAATSFLADNPSGQTLSELYDTFKKEEEELMETYKAEHGGSYLGGQVSGGIATLPLGGVFGRAGQFLFGVGGRGATLGQTAKQAASAGALQAGLAGAGMGDDLESRLTGAATGATVGGVLGGTLAASGYKLAEKIANSSSGLVTRAGQLGATPKSTIELTEDLTPQLTRLAESANLARDAAYSGWRGTLEGAVQNSGIKVARSVIEDNAPKVVSTKELKKLVKGFDDDVVDNKKNLKAILNEEDVVTFDTYRNLYTTAWDLQKQLPRNIASPFAKRLSALKGDEYRQLDRMFPKKGIGTARETLDKAVASAETGQLLNKEIVEKIAKGEPLDPTFAKQFLPKNADSYNKFTALTTRINSWAKEANVSPREVEDILSPLRANALSDAVNNPSILKSLARKETSEDMTLFRHYKDLLTPEQFQFVNKLSVMPIGHLQNRIRSLMDYYSGTALLGLGGVGGATLVAGNAAGMAILGLYLLSPVLVNPVAKNKQVLALANKVLTSPSETPPKELAKLTNSLGKAALKAGIITPSSAINSLNRLNEMNQQRKQEEQQQ